MKMIQMTKFKWQIFRWLAKKIVVQGGHHVNVRTAYKIINDEAQAVYTEETNRETNQFLRTQFKHSILNDCSYDNKAEIK